MMIAQRLYVVGNRRVIGRAMGFVRAFDGGFGVVACEASCELHFQGTGIYRST